MMPRYNTNEMSTETNTTQCDQSTSPPKDGKGGIVLSAAVANVFLLLPVCV